MQSKRKKKDIFQPNHNFSLLSLCSIYDNARYDNSTSTIIYNYIFLSTNKRLHLKMVILVLTIAAIGVRKCNFPPFQEIIPDQQTDRPGHRVAKFSNNSIILLATHGHTEQNESPSQVRGDIKKVLVSDVAHHKVEAPQAVAVKLPLFVGGNCFCLESPDKG